MGFSLYVAGFNNQCITLVCVYLVTSPQTKIGTPTAYEDPNNLRMIIRHLCYRTRISYATVPAVAVAQPGTAIVF